MPTPGGNSPVTTFGLSGDTTLDAFINIQYKWGAGGIGTPASLTYSFPQPGASWVANYGEGEPGGLTGFNASQQAATTAALSLWSDVANITFTQVTESPTEVGDIRFGFSSVVSNDPFAIAWGYFPYNSPEAGDIWFDPTYGPNLQMAPGQFGFSTLLHEIGHAIGLDHPFDDGFGEATLPAYQDSNQYTIMAYDLHPTASVEAMSPMLLDILAIQYLYGANMTTRTGDDVYTFSAASEVLKAIWDAGGVDTIDASNQTLAAKIDLNDGAFSSIGRRNAGGSASNNIAIAYGALIENAKGGSGGDTLTGNEVANLLYGNAGADTLAGGLGNDTLDGGTGSDKMFGGAGNDYYFIDSASDTIDEQGNADTGDQIFASVAVNLTTLGKNQVENVILTSDAALNIVGGSNNNFLAGREGANNIAGGGGDDFLFGLGGNDTLTDVSGSNYMEGGTGNDIMTGGTGTDAMYGGDGDDVMNSGAGSVNYLDGGAGNDKLTGDIGNDTLLGGLGTDTLTGNGGSDFLDGGAGDDVMTGGQGADIYVVDSLGDKVTETGGAADGPDEIRTVFSIDLGTFAGGVFEHTRLQGNADLNATGNAAFNLLWGNGASNTLLGLGGGDLLDAGLGADVMKGGVGNDIYVVENAGDVVDEEGNNDSSDTVMGLFSFDLNTYAGGKMENAILLGPASLNAIGTEGVNQLIGAAGKNTLEGKGGNDILVGNEGDDTLLGGEGNDILIGGLGNDTLDGGPGIDTLIGAEGNDIYLLADLNDTISEGTNKDIGDEIRAAFSITLANFDGGSIENATLFGTADINATGTSANNKLVGNSGVNTLDGGTGNDYLDGGLGDDVLRGGAGNDTYDVDSLGDTVDEQGNKDTDDEIRTGSVSLALAIVGSGSIEHATLLGNAALDLTGTNAANKLTGNSAANTLDGGGGNDVLDGGLGDDTLIGGAGNDLYIIDSVGDVINEQANADVGDEVRSANVSINLGTLASGKIEIATLLGAAVLDLTGNSAGNILTGNSAINVLDGGGGADTLRGGAGNDVYIVDSASDVIDEQGNTDIADEVRSSSITLNLSNLAGGAIENATLLGSGFLGLTGNTLNNILTGNSGNNQIFGLEGNDLIIAGDGVDHLDGGAGDDVMKGGSGNDTYILSSLQDVVDEEGNTDTADIVKTQVDVDLSILAGGAIENATALGTTVSLKGNDGDNTLTGNVYANVLDGGKGDDTLIGNGDADKFFGGEGNDVIVVSSTTDVSIVTIDGGTGTDTLKYTGNLDLGKVAQSVIQGIEVIDFSGGAASTFTAYAQDVADLSSTSTKLFVLGDANDSISLKEMATFSGLASIGGVDYRIYSYGSSSVYVEDGIAVSSAVAAQVALGQLPGFQIAGPSTFRSGYSLRFGTHVDGIGDFNNDGFEDVLISSGRDAAYLLYGQADAYPLKFSADSSIGTDIAQLAGPAGSWVGVSFSGLGDFDGDGNLDLAVGASKDDLNGVDSGGAYVVYGGDPGILGQESLSSMAALDGSIVSGPGAGALAGSYLSVQGGGDFNGDGYDELVIATPDVASTADHAAYVIFGAPNTPATFTLPTLGAGGGFKFTASSESMIGATVASAGDLNGDGYDDIVIGNNASAAHVVFGGSSVPASITAGSLNGSNGFNISGARAVLSSGGDFNGDGYDDLLVADSFAGMAYVVFGKSSGFSANLDVSSLNGINGFAIQGSGIGGSGAGGCLTGDYNADGFDDLLIGAPASIGLGSALLIYGHAGVADALVTANELDGINGLRIMGVSSGDRAGEGIAASDINGDGFDDILVGTSYGDGDATDSGTLDVIYGADFRNSGVLTGFSGADTLNGSGGANQISAGQGSDTINGGGGADAINAGQGNDEIHVTDNKFFRIDGGTGIDTLHLDYSGAIDFSNLDGNAATSDRGRIENVEILDVVNGHANAMTLHLADVLDLDVTVSNVGGVAALDNVLRIDGESGDTLQLFSADGWGAADTSSLTGYAIYTYQAVKVAVDTDIVISVT